MRSLLACCVFVLFLVGCGDNSGCLPDLPGMAPCPAGIFVDASTIDPICLSAGVPLCRGKSNADCYVCAGGDFPDNCTLTSPQQTTECVHSCDKC
jgi:hypothetical protein